MASPSLVIIPSPSPLLPRFLVKRVLISRPIGTVDTFLDSSQNQLLGLLDTLLSTDDLDSLVLGLVAGHRDLASALLADGVHLAAALADDVAVRARVGKDEVSSGVLLGGLCEVGLDQFLGLLDVLGRAPEDPGDIAFLGRRQLDDLPGVDIGVAVILVGDKREGTFCSPDSVGDGQLLRDGVTGVVNRDLVVTAELAEELAIVGDGVVELAGYLNGLALLLLDEGEDVFLGLLDVGGLSDDLNAGMAAALAGDVERDLEL